MEKKQNPPGIYRHVCFTAPFATHFFGAMSSVYDNDTMCYIIISSFRKKKIYE